MDEGAAVVVRRHVQYVDDGPYATADTYLPLELVKDSPIVDPRAVLKKFAPAWASMHEMHSRWIASRPLCSTRSRILALLSYFAFLRQTVGLSG